MNKKISRHIFFDPDIYTQIQQDASRLNISVNNFVNTMMYDKDIYIQYKYSTAQAKLIHHDIAQLTSHVNALATVLNRSLRQNKLLFDSADLDKILTQLTALTLETRKVADKYDSQTK